MTTERYSLQDADELNFRANVRASAPATSLQFPGGSVSLPKPTRAALTVTARSWLKLAMATGANAERLLNDGDDVREAVADLESMARNIRMALAALGER